MSQEEFDIQVRNLLQNAEERVSPKVWEGVASQLERKRRGVIVRRYWGAFAGVALAAAAVALFLILRPSVQPALQGAQDQPVLANVVSVEDVVTIPVQEEAPEALLSAPIRPQAVNLSQPEVAVTPEMVQRSAIPAQLLLASVSPAQPERLSPRQVPVPVMSVEEDQVLLNRLAQEERALPDGKGWSLLASTHLQSNQRGEGAAFSGTQFSAPPLNAGIGIYDESPEVSFGIPVTAGVGVRYHFSPRWSLGTGLRYSYLRRTFEGDYVGDGFMVLKTTIDNEQHMLGIPLDVYYHIVNRSRWNVHTFAGVLAEYVVNNAFLVHNSPKDIPYYQQGWPLQWSGAVGLGVEFKITPNVGIYLDPNFRYYFGTELQPRSIRSEHPLRFDIEAGIRFSFGKQ